MRRSTTEQVDRRSLLKLGGASLAGVLLGRAGIVSADAVRPAPEKAGARRILRVAHMTDLHVQPERGGDQGLAAALHHVQSLEDRPDLILTGGDTVMDSFGQDNARTTLQWNLFKSVMRQECSLPVRCCIGNHDAWGWNREHSGTTGNEPLWGKKRAEQELGLPNRYYSFDQAGWHFVVLDSTYPDGNGGYIAKLDDEQLDWLRSDLASTSKNRPVLLVSHQPIFSAAPFFNSKGGPDGNWTLNRATMNVDARSLWELFKQHPNVKLALSGHLHLVDRVDYCGVTYLCNGAVCGAWWKGDHRECDEGYGLVDLYDDGSFDQQYVAYNWHPVPEPADNA